MKVSVNRFNRWAQFNFNGNCIALLNPKFDEELINNGNDREVHFDSEYLNYFKGREVNYGNNVVLNFHINDLSKEYERIKELNIGEMTNIMYLSISSPYHHFILKDPDGNLIEITGNYDN